MPEKYKLKVRSWKPTKGMNQKPLKLFYQYWGKVAQTEGNGLSYHLLPYHCLDVAAVGWILLNPEKPLCVRLAGQPEVAQTWLRDFFVFCLSLHDLGKFSRAFQGLKKELSDTFRKSVCLPANQAGDLNYTDERDKREQELRATAYCHAWLADIRKKNVLSTPHYIHTTTLDVLASLTGPHLFSPNRRRH